MLGVMNADVYAIAVGTVARGWESSDGECLFQTAVVDGWGVGISMVYGERCAPFRECEKHGYVS